MNLTTFFIFCCVVSFSYAILHDCREIQVYTLESLAESKTESLYNDIGIWQGEATVFYADYESRIFTPTLQLTGRQVKKWEDGKYIDTFCFLNGDACISPPSIYWTYLDFTTYIPGVHAQGCVSTNDPTYEDLISEAQQVSNIHWVIDRFYKNGTFYGTEDIYNTVVHNGQVLERHVEIKTFNPLNPNIGTLTQFHQFRIFDYGFRNAHFI